MSQMIENLVAHRTGNRSELDRGRRLRAAQAESHGVATGRSHALLVAIGSLEHREYDNAAGAPLDVPARLALWRHRAELAGIDPATALSDEQAATIVEYWDWLTSSAETDSPFDLTADVVDAVAGSPAIVPAAENAWRRQGEVVGAHAATAVELGKILLAAASDPGARGVQRSHDAALLIATLSGLPDSLVDLHRRSAASARSFVLDAVSARSRAQLRSADTAGAPGSEPPVGDETVSNLRAPRTAARGDAVVLLPSTGTALDSAVHETKAGATSIQRQVLIDSVRALRRGATPSDDVLLTVANNAWRERVARRLEVDALAAAPAVKRDPRSVPEVAASAAQMASFAAARRLVLLELDRVYRTMTFEVDLGDLQAVFPADVYGPRLSSDFGQDHLLAAFNCLRTLTSRAVLTSSGVVVTPQRQGQREITLHMARSAPDMWGGEGNGRQLRRGFAGAVACIAQTAVAKIDLTGLSTDLALVADEFKRALGVFCAVAVVDGLGAMMLRYRLTRSALRADEPQTHRWHEQVRATMAWVSAATDVMRAGPSAAVRCGAGGLADDFDTVVERMAQLSPQLPEHDFEATVATAAATADVLRSSFVGREQ